MTRSDTRFATSLLDILFEEPDVGRCLVAPDDSVLRANREWLRSTGFLMEEVLGANVLDLFPETRDMAAALYARARAGHRVDVPRHAQHIGGRETCWEGHIDPVGMEGGTGLLITAREVSAGECGASDPEADTAARARESEKRLVEAQRLAKVGDWEWDVTTGIITWSRQTYVMFGRSPLRPPPSYDELARYFEPASWSVLDSAVKRAVEAGEPYAVEVEYVRDDGARGWHIARGEATKDSTGTVVRLRGTAQDITDRKRYEEALRDSERRFATMFRRSPLAKAWTKLPEGTLADVNDAWVTLTGIPREEAIGRSTGELGLVGPEDRGRFHEDLVARGTAEAEVELFTRTNGTRVTFVRGELVSLGGEQYLLGAMQDITDRKRAEVALRESEERARSRAAELQTVLDAVPAAVWISRDPRGDRIDANDYGAELLRRRRGDNVSLTSPVERLRHFTVQREGREIPEDELPIQRAARRGEEIRDTEFALVFDDGEVRHMLGNSVPLRDADGRVKGSVGAFIDVTHRKEAEEALREADRRRTEFLAVLSHELRNPLAPIRNGIYVLDAAPPGSEQAARAKEIIRRQTDHLARLVDDLLDVMRISRAKIQLQRKRIDVREVVRKTMDDLRSLFERTRIELRVEHALGPVWVDGDATRIAQVVANLLLNSLKFTPARGVVTVSLAAADGRVRLGVRDSGIGMAPGQLERMFEPFAQADQGLARSSGGLGLGLYLVKSIVELHGGTVEARSEGVGRGAEFVVSLPLAEPEAVPEGSSTGAVAGAVRDVLVIEDNPDAAETLADVLTLLGHRVRVATKGAAGLALARERRPDVILCDVGLPDMDGYEVARTLRREGSLEGTRLVALTGYAQTEDRQRAFEAGFDAHLPKPPDVDALRSVLASDS